MIKRSGPSTQIENRENWYAVHTRAHHENRVDAYFLIRGFETFYPAQRVKPVNPRAATIRPYFPGYLFIHVNLAATGLGFISSVPGLIGLVQFDGQPTPVPEIVIDELKHRLGTLQEAGSAIQSGQTGTWSRSRDGPLAGYEDMLDLKASSGTRIKLLIELLRDVA